jgi:hypothetical protein
MGMRGQSPNQGGKTMTQDQAKEIRTIVDSEGWDGVRRHPELSKVWAKELRKQKDFENALED